MRKFRYVKIEILGVEFNKIEMILENSKKFENLT